MNSKLYGPRPQVTHISGAAQCRRGLPSASTAIQSGCAVAHVVVGRVRVGARDDDHAELAAAGDQFAERIAVAQPTRCGGGTGSSSDSRPRSRRR